MKIVVSELIAHTDSNGQNSAVYSVDFHPDGSRFCTGGGDCAVNIWRTSVVDAQSEGELLLASLVYHTKSVNIVRWSHCGSLLASGSDDHLVKVYARKAGTSMSSAAFGKRNVENWSRNMMMQGHTMDVLDVCWAPDDQSLVSCSIDNTVIVWKLSDAHANSNTNTIPPHRVLRGHKSFVKGVAFDPIGRYLASISSDNSMQIWDMRSGQPAVSVTKPFEGTPDNTLFRRLSWAPDGGCVCVSAAREQGKPVAQLLTRTSWAKVVDLVGHPSQIVSARFNPVIFEGNSEATCCVAVGDRNGVISVWLSNSKRPAVVIRDMFDGFVSDIAWSHDGRSLACAGSTGQVAIVTFGQELGTPMTEHARTEHLRGLYGGDVENMIRGRELVETPLLLMTKPSEPAQQNATRLDLSANVAQRNGGSAARLGSVSDSSPALVGARDGKLTKAVADQQQISRTVTGKKRIRPVLMAEDGDVGFRSGVEVESGNDGNAVSMQPPLPSARMMSSDEGLGLGRDQHVVSNRRPSLSQGLVSGLGPELEFSCSSGFMREGVLTRLWNSREHFVCHVFAEETRSGSRLELGIKHSMEIHADVSSLTSSSELALYCTRVKAVEVKAGRQDQEKDPSAPAATHATLHWESQIAGRCMCLRANPSVVCVGCEDGTVHVLCTESGLRLVPPLVIGTPAAFVDVKRCKNLVCVLAISATGETYVWDVLSRKCCVRTSVKPLVEALMWSFNDATNAQTSSVQPAQTRRRPANPNPNTNHNIVASNTPSSSTSISCLVQEAWLSPEGMPMVCVSCKDAEGGGTQTFAFDSDMCVFVRVSDLRHALSHFFTSRPVTTSPGDASERPLEQAHSQTLRIANLQPSDILRAFRTGTGVARGKINEQCTLSHLEDRISCSVSLLSTSDFTKWFENLVWFLASTSAEARLRWMCYALLASDKQAGDVQEEVRVAWAGQVCRALGTDGRAVIRQCVLPAVARSHKMQGLLEEISDALDMLPTNTRLPS